MDDLIKAIKEHSALTEEEIGMTEKDVYELQLHYLRTEPDMYVACYNCEAHEACDYCVHGGNTPPIPLKN